VPWRHWGIEGSAPATRPQQRPAQHPHVQPKPWIELHERSGSWDNGASIGAGGLILVASVGSLGNSAFTQVPAEKFMSWFDALTIDRSRLLTGASPETILSVEEQLKCRFPAEYRQFLESADGGIVKTFLFYSAGAGLHPAETLLSVNGALRPDHPLVCIGRDASDDFGFLRSDLPCEVCPVYFIFHETLELDRVAGSFADFMSEIAHLRGEERFVPRRLDLPQLRMRD
jgi:hypothetical protein